MLIRSRMGVSADGFAATPDGLPAWLAMPGFVPGVSHGLPEFISGCDAVVMGRTTFLPALGAPRWPWPGLQVYVLTSRPLPPDTPADVIVAHSGPAGLAGQLRSRRSGRDVHLVGGPRTIRAFQQLGALDLWVPKTFAAWADSRGNASAQDLRQVAGGPVCTWLCVR